MEGPGVWWKEVEDGIEFFDCVHEAQVPEHKMHHFRSSNLSDIHLYLQTKWEECNANNIRLPASEIRHYNPDGNLTVISTVIPHLSDLPTCPSQTESELHSHQTTSFPEVHNATSSNTPLSDMDKASDPRPSTDTPVNIGICQSAAEATSGEDCSSNGSPTLALETPSEAHSSSSPNYLSPDSAVPKERSSRNNPRRSIPPKPTPGPTYKTTFVRNLAKLLSDHSKLTTLDMLRHKIKTIKDTKKNIPRAMEAKCEKLSNYMKRQVEVVHAKQTDLLANLEAEFQKKHGRKPRKGEYTSSMKTAASLKSLASRLLQHEWNV